MRLDEGTEVLIEPVQFFAPGVAGNLLGLHDSMLTLVWHLSLVDYEYGAMIVDAYESKT